MNKKLLCLILMAFCAQVMSCGEKTHTVSLPAMGTLFTITVVCTDAEAAKIFEAVSIEVKRLEKLMSPYLPESDIYRLNNEGKAKLTPETYNIIERSVAMSKASDGAFDISFVPLGAIWNYKAENFVLPSAARIKQALALVDYRNILFSNDNTVSFAKTGMQIGLGGIAKGYAVDCIETVMRNMGAKAGMADAGGNLSVFGKGPNGLWNVGVRHPRAESVICTVKLESGEAVSTSGDYERFVMYNGKRYHHIIDPKTGFPAQGLISVTVICKGAELADAASTAIFVMGPKRSEEFLKQHSDLSVIMIDSQLNVYASKRLQNRLSFFEKLDITWLP